MKSPLQVLAQWTLAARGDQTARALVARLLGRMLLIVADPIVEYEHGGSPIRLQLSHALPRYRAAFPEYDMPLVDVAVHLELDPLRSVIVDVGANVGDSVVLLRSHTQVPIVAVEGLDTFLGLLRENTAAIDAVEIVPQFVGTSASSDGLGATARNGTARLERTGGVEVSVEPLDDVLEVSELARGRRVALLKSDTDGFELSVLASGAAMLERDQPTLVLEYDPPLLQRHGADPRDLRSLLTRLGYRTCWVYDNIGNPMWPLELGDDVRFGELDRFLWRRHPDFYCDLVVPSATGAESLTQFLEGRFMSTTLPDRSTRTP